MRHQRSVNQRIARLDDVARVNAEMLVMGNEVLVFDP